MQEMPACDDGDDTHDIAIMPASGAAGGTATYVGNTGVVSMISGAIPDAILDVVEYPTRTAMSPRADRLQTARDKARWLRRT
jgi:hypothetical protein